MFITWKELGEPEEPGLYEIGDLGTIRVTQRDIDMARERAGQVKFKLAIDETAPTAQEARYRLDRVDVL